MGEGAARQSFEDCPPIHLKSVCLRHLAGCYDMDHRQKGLQCDRMDMSASMISYVYLTLFMCVLYI